MTPLTPPLPQTGYVKRDDVVVRLYFLQISGGSHPVADRPLQFRHTPPRSSRPVNAPNPRAHTKQVALVPARLEGHVSPRTRPALARLLVWPRARPGLTQGNVGRMRGYWAASVWARRALPLIAPLTRDLPRASLWGVRGRLGRLRASSADYVRLGLATSE